MLSILIPVYNYKITDLINEISKQVEITNKKFEIICFDDNSEKYVIENTSTINSLPHVRIISSTKNVGRIQAREFLSNQAIYDWILFLDADIFPKSDKFIQNYLDKTNSTYDAIYGGFAYSNKKPNKDSTLRWKYGKKFEEVDAKKRNLKPYQLIISANFFIKKTIFNKINSEIKRKSYGIDNYFGALLKKYNVNVLHLNNEVYHYGIEKSITYLKKTEEAIGTLLWMHKEKNVYKHNNKLLTMFLFLKKIKLNYLIIIFYKNFHARMKKNLTSSNPNILLFQIYKLSYICYKDLN